MKRIRILFFTTLIGVISAISCTLADSLIKDGDSDPTNMTNNFIDPSCLTTNASSGDSSVKGFAAKSVHPLSARIVECIEGTMQGFFLTTSSSAQATLFQVMQRILQGFVMLMLILYIMLMGYAVVTGQYFGGSDMKKDLIIFIFRFALVFYFAAGDAWKDFFFVALRSISSTFSHILISAGTDNQNYDGCLFPQSLYPPSKSYISVFDTLDCKFGNYIGWFRGQPLPALIMIAFSYSIFPQLLGSIVTTLSGIFILQIIMLAARVTQLYLVSITLLTILIFACPLIIPMVLFDYTHDVFKKWFSKVIALTMHPILVFGMLGITISVTDAFFYGKDPIRNNLFSEEDTFNKDALFGGAGTEREQAEDAGISHYYLFMDNEDSLRVYREKFNSDRLKASTLNGEDLKKMAFKTFFPALNYEMYRKIHTGESPPNVGTVPQDTMLKALSRVRDQNYPNSDSDETLAEYTEREHSLAPGDIHEMSDSAVHNLYNKRNKLSSDTVKWFSQQITEGDIELSKLKANTGVGVLNNSAGEGAFVNKNCWGGSFSYNFKIVLEIPIVCVIAWLASEPISLALPIPGLIELFRVYLPYRIDLVIFLIVKLMIVIVLTLIITIVFEQLEPVIDKLTGESIRDMGTYFSAFDAMKAVKHIKKGADKTKDKAKGKDKDKDKDKKGGGSSAEGKGEKGAGKGGEKRGGAGGASISGGASGDSGGGGGDSGGSGGGGGGGGGK